jgi:hypothetical protein
MRITILFATVLTAAQVLGAEIVTHELISTADQLDQMVAQEPVLKKTSKLPKSETTTEALPPLNVERIAPLAAKKLNIDQAELAKLLNNRENLSKIAMSKILEESTGKSWKELLKSKTRGELLRMVDEQKLAGKLKKTLDDLYTDVSFVAMDRLEKESTAVGGAPGSVKGKGKEVKDK